MSRIGKLPVSIPSGVTITIQEGAVTVKGAKGELAEHVPPGITVNQENGTVVVARSSEHRYVKAAHGLMRTLVYNMVVGVSDGYEKKLEVNGVGFRISGGGQQIDLSLGYSHPIKYAAPSGITLAVDKNIITVSGISKQMVGQVAAEIRALRKPEPYKGKGIKYANEHIIRKAGKTSK